MLQIANNKYSIAHKTEHVRLGTKNSIQNSTIKISECKKYNYLHRNVNVLRLCVLTHYH